MNADNPHPGAQQTYTISELAREFGITTRTIRFYEEQGLLSPRREGQKRIYSPADRVRIRLILRGKRIGMSLKESAEVIDMYNPGDNNDQLHALLANLDERQDRLLQQKRDIDDMLAGLDEVRQLCRKALRDNHTGAPVQGPEQD